MGKGERRQGGRRAVRKAGSKRRPIRGIQRRIGVRRGVGHRTVGRKHFMTFRQGRKRRSRGKLVSTIGGWFGANEDNENIILADAETHDEDDTDLGSCDYDVCVTVSFLCMVAGGVMSIPGIALVIHGQTYGDDDNLVVPGISLIVLGGVILLAGLIGCICLRHLNLGSHDDNDDDDNDNLDDDIGAVAQIEDSRILHDAGQSKPCHVSPAHDRPPSSVIDMKPMYNVASVMQGTDHTEVHVNLETTTSHPQQDQTAPSNLTILPQQNNNNLPTTDNASSPSYSVEVTMPS